jgi:ATP-dependent Clp protease protease subunit
MIQAKEILRIRDVLNRILSDNTGQPLDKIVQDTDRDHFMTAQEALEYGLVDRVMSRASKEG